MAENVLDNNLYLWKSSFITLHLRILGFLAKQSFRQKESVRLNFVVL